MWLLLSEWCTSFARLDWIHALIPEDHKHSSRPQVLEYTLNGSGSIQGIQVARYNSRGTKPYEEIFRVQE